MDDYQNTLRRLALRDEALVASALAGAPWELDPRSRALVRLGATVAVDADLCSYQHAVERALAAGVSSAEIVGTLIAVMSLTGVPRAVSAAPKIGLALGYDIDAALE